MNKNYKELILKTKGRKEFIEKQISKTQSELSAYSHKLELIEKAQIFLQEVARKTQENLKYQIEDIVNLALETGIFIKHWQVIQDACYLGFSSQI